MQPTFLLVDFENVRELMLSRLPDDWSVRIFVGRSQQSIPFSLASDAQKLGDRLEWIRIEGDGRNNLDFHLVYYLGELVRENSQAAYLILSRDKGFDALIAHLSKKGIQCGRIEQFEQIAVTVKQPEDPHFTRAYEVLRKIEKKTRPRRRKTLQQLVSSVFQKKEPEAEIARIVERFFKLGLVSEKNDALSYTF